MTYGESERETLKKGDQEIRNAEFHFEPLSRNSSSPRIKSCLFFLIGSKHSGALPAFAN
jgi:hypothetical protein